MTLSPSVLLLLALAQPPMPGKDAAARLERIRPGPDGRQFVGVESGRRFVVWGVNYDHDAAGRLLEDYWEREWETVVGDFREMKALGANVVRIHLQVARFLDAPDRANAANLARFAKLVALADETGLYLDVTGLGCYHKQDVPAWYDALDESARWAAQAFFWQAIARAGRRHPAIFCYDLMNEPILPGMKPEKDWLGAEFGGKHFVQRIALDLKGRSREDVARLWIRKLSAAIHGEDDRTMLTVGVIPWAHVFKGAKPLFHAPGVGDPLDFVAVHFYPKSKDVEGSLAALRVYALGKPLVVEEIFPLNCTAEEVERFIDGSRPFCDGWVSFYWGQTIEDSAKAGDLKGALVAAWLRRFRDRAPGWTQLPALPDREGFAGSFAGTSGGALLVAGGANFPDRKPWEGGTKVWTDTVFALEKPDGEWRIAGALPRKLGYGVCVSHGAGVVSAGGSDANGHYPDAFRLVWKDGRLETLRLPPLPKSIANAGGARVGDVLYVVGGLEKPDAGEAESTVHALDLADPKAVWRTIAPVPGPGRMLAMVAGHGGDLWCAGGVELVLRNGRPERVYRKDAYRYRAGEGWTRLADLPRPLAAAPAFADASGFTILGGDDGAQVTTAPHDHRGFQTAMLRYDPGAARWRDIGPLAAPRVTVSCVDWRGRLVVPGGEVRPGVRSPEVWSWPAARK